MNLPKVDFLDELLSVDFDHQESDNFHDIHKNDDINPLLESLSDIIDQPLEDASEHSKNNKRVLEYGSYESSFFDDSTIPLSNAGPSDFSTLSHQSHEGPQLLNADGSFYEPGTYQEKQTDYSIYRRGIKRKHPAETISSPYQEFESTNEGFFHPGEIHNCNIYPRIEVTTMPGYNQISIVQPSDNIDTNISNFQSNAMSTPESTTKSSNPAFDEFLRLQSQGIRMQPITRQRRISTKKKLSTQYPVVKERRKRQGVNIGDLYNMVKSDLQNDINSESLTSSDDCAINLDNLYSLDLKEFSSILMSLDILKSKFKTLLDFDDDKCFIFHKNNFFGKICDYLELLKDRDIPLHSCQRLTFNAIAKSFSKAKPSTKSTQPYNTFSHLFHDSNRELRVSDGYINKAVKIIREIIRTYQILIWMKSTFILNERLVDFNDFAYRIWIFLDDISKNKKIAIKMLENTPEKSK